MRRRPVVQLRLLGAAAAVLAAAGAATAEMMPEPEKKMGHHSMLVDFSGKAHPADEGVEFDNKDAEYHPPHYLHGGATEEPLDWDPNELHPEKIPYEWNHYAEFYCPLNDDDCGWKPDRKNKFCWKFFPHTEATYENAYHDCKARSIKGCPSHLLAVDSVGEIFDSMTFEDVEYCPEWLRMDGAINPENKMWYKHGDLDAEMWSNPLYFPGAPWTNGTYEPFDPNLKDGSLAVNFGARTVAGFPSRYEDYLGVACQSCIVEIPECPGVCERCDEGTSTTPMSTTTETPTPWCSEINGDMKLSVIGGTNVLTDEMNSKWMLYDENYNQCDAGDEMPIKDLLLGTTLAFYHLPEQLSGYGMDKYNSFLRRQWAGADIWGDEGLGYNGFTQQVNAFPWNMVMIAGGYMKDDKDQMHVTDKVYMQRNLEFYSHTLFRGILNSVSRSGGAAEDESLTPFLAKLRESAESGRSSSSGGGGGGEARRRRHRAEEADGVEDRDQGGIPAMFTDGPSATENPNMIDSLDNMAMPRAEFALMDLYTAHGFDEVIAEHFVAYGGVTCVDGDGGNPELTDTIEMRNFLPSEGKLEDLFFGDGREGFMGAWEVNAQFKLTAPSRTIGINLFDEYAEDSSDSDFAHSVARHYIALIDTSPVQFNVFRWDNATYRTLALLPEEQTIPDLMLADPEAELVGFAFTNMTGQDAFLAIDDRTRNVYVLPFNSLIGPADAWERMPDAIPYEARDARHLITKNEDRSLESRSPVSLLAYDPYEEVTVVKFWDGRKNRFGDMYPEFSAGLVTDMLPYPVKIDLPPMKGAQFGLDASQWDPYGSQFTLSNGIHLLLQLQNGDCFENPFLGNCMAILFGGGLDRSGGGDSAAEAPEVSSSRSSAEYRRLLPVAVASLKEGEEEDDVAKAASRERFRAQDASLRSAIRQHERDLVAKEKEVMRARSAEKE